MNRGQMMWEKAHFEAMDAFGTGRVFVLAPTPDGVSVSSEGATDGVLSWAEAARLRDYLNLMLEEVDEFDGIPV